MYHALILAGGSGTRLWPLSREGLPKQALTLVGQRSMFQHAVDRIATLFVPEQVWVATRAGYVELLAGQMPDIPAANFIAEPYGRGTAAAIGLAAIHLRRRDPQAVMAVLTADHYIQRTDAFQQALQAACAVAEDGYLVTLGIRPDAPATGFGYVQQGECLGQAGGLPYYRVQRFIEKPEAATAQRMLAEGGYSWNSGMFVWRAAAILAEFERQMPQLYARLVEVEAVIGTPAYAPVLAQVWAEIQTQTIDYGVMEHARQVAVIPVEIGWTDVGSWGSLLALLPSEDGGNIWVGPHLGLETRNCLVFGENRLVVTLGVQDLVVVDTPDALLVMSKAYEQQVKRVVEVLKSEGRKDLV